MVEMLLINDSVEELLFSCSCQCWSCINHVNLMLFKRRAQSVAYG